MSRPDFLNQVCRQKLGAVPEWEVCSWRVVGDDGLLVEGGIPRLLTRGKNKGRKRWDGPIDRLVVVESEIDAARAAFEKETGKCANCGGDGKEWAGWSVSEGNTYKTCSKCKGTGAAA